MRHQQLHPLLVTAFKSGRKVLIKGPPGVGKSDLVAQVCDELQFDLCISHPAVSDPTDYKGMPAIVPDTRDGHVSGHRLTAEFLPFGDLLKLINAERPTIAFLDDIGQASPAVQAALMQLLLARQVNGHRLSDHVVFCGATNDTKHMAGVSGMLEPVKSRWDTIVSLECPVDDWCAWALDHDMPHELIAFIRFRPALLNDFKPSRDLTNSPCPRTVAAVGHWLNNGVRDPEILTGAAGEGFATELLAFLGMYAQLPNLDALLLNPDTAPVPTQPAALYAVITGLVRKATRGNADRFFRYLTRLPKEFEVCAVRDAARVKDLVNTRAFIEWSSNSANIRLLS